jgi:predicted flap endonuclease-1-like 5' DNA nuclease
MTTIPCILIPLLVGLISAILGYLLGRLNSKSNSNSNNNYQLEYDNCLNNSKLLNDKIAQLELNLSNSNKQTTIIPAPETSMKTGFAATSNTIEAEELPFDSALAANVFGKKIKHNDLKIIEGIGPKIEALYHQANIKTWKQLSETNQEKSQEILKSGGERFKLHNPSTWAKQAKLSYEGKWDELKKWQDELDGGRE